jgi:hypothetical protein
MNKSREQWQKVDPKWCAENSSAAANYYLIADAQADIECLYREISKARDLLIRIDLLMAAECMAEDDELRKWLERNQ